MAVLRTAFFIIMNGVTVVNNQIKELRRNYSSIEIQERAIQVGKRYTSSINEARLLFLVNWLFGSKVNFKNDESFNVKEFINELLIRYYPTETIIKHAFIKFARKSGVYIFELPIGNSRVDICRINKFSHAFEIKTEYDVLNRLEKQIADYAEVFDYVSVVIASSLIAKVEEIIPRSCGIYVYEHMTGALGIHFVHVRKSLKNFNINSTTQLQTLSKKTLDAILMQSKEKNSITDTDVVSNLKEHLSEQQINYNFKKALTEKYFKKWNMDLKRLTTILPIDF